ncbi:hypothetical protein Poli38472_011644 [Pythium oligandrum]|uniref:Uncharacterized protein n=1 Tax=Pythium oligandrum TaxID=41045 RepID=A0A8K1CJK5_PYTOL|nr:hypothetical protein Poli38472_011644 [Pythium oligandrum]|eukprot:TMW64764.1 hypothetical protein Poli38472_011644 [Pythium oligandrum]
MAPRSRSLRDLLDGIKVVMVQLRVLGLLVAAVAIQANARYADDDVVGKVVPYGAAAYENREGDQPLQHWVGPTVGVAKDTACYRKTHPTKKCPPGYNSDNIATCWAQCPLEYPVECGMECLPQNEDCTKAILRKVTSVATVALNAASSGMFGKIATASKGLTQGVKCAQQILATVQKVTGYVNELESKGTPLNGTGEDVKFLLSKSDLITNDLPTAVATCIGKPLPAGLQKSTEILDKVKAVTDQVLAAKASGTNLLEPQNFIKMVSDVGFSSAMPALKSNDDVSKIKDLVSKGLGCGDALNKIVNRVIGMIQEIKTKDASTTVEALRVAVMGSDLVLKELPDAATNCFKVNMPNAFQKRDEVLKGIHLVLDGAINAASANAPARTRGRALADEKPLSTGDYALKVTEMGLDSISTFDPTGIAEMAKEFVQPICGPTVFVGEIDDGPADQALGLRTVQNAFMSSKGDWKKKGNGQAKIIFKSVDNKDVEVIIKSGGQVHSKVKVGKGKTVEWSKPLSELQGKTMYMDRWRPGLLGISGTGGGSLLLWIPNSAGGELNLDVSINPS